VGDSLSFTYAIYYVQCVILACWILCFRHIRNINIRSSAALKNNMRNIIKNQQMLSLKIYRQINRNFHLLDKFDESVWLRCVHNIYASLCVLYSSKLSIYHSKNNLKCKFRPIYERNKKFNYFETIFWFFFAALSSLTETIGACIFLIIANY
jgi:hypothetical protein